MGIVILTEDKIHQFLFFIHQWKTVDLMLPDNIVGFFQRGFLSCINKILKFRHKFCNRHITPHSCHAIVLVCYKTQKLSVCLSIFCNRYSRMSCLFCNIQNIAKCHIRRYIGITHYKACTVSLNLANHLCLFVNWLRAINEGHTSFLCQSDCKTVIRYGLHDCRHHRNVNGKCRLLSFFKFHQRCFQTYG